MELLLESGPAAATLEAAPFEVLRRRGTVDFGFRATRTWRARGPGGLRWELSPECRVEARLLFSGSAFLGNFRVPADSCGVQWRVVGRVTSSAKRSLGPSLLEATSGSWINYTWVDMVPLDASPQEALLAGWAGFHDLFDPDEIRRVPARQVCQLTWSGRVRLGFRLDLDLVRGWQVGSTLGLVELDARLRAGIGLGFMARLEREGTYSLRVQRKGSRLRMTLRRQNARERTVGVEVGAFGSTGPGLQAGSTWIDPLLEPLRDRIEKAVKKRLELVVAAEASNWSRRKSLIQADWVDASESEFVRTYRSLLEGNLAVHTEGLETSSLVEQVRGRRMALRVHFLNWLSFGVERIAEHRTTFRVDPLGNLLVEEGWLVEEDRYRWDERQFFKLLAEGPKGSDCPLVWTFGREGSLSRDALQAFLEPTLGVGAVESFEIPGRSSFPLDLRALWATEISVEGIAALRAADPARRWEALVRTMEMADPRRYRAGSFWRDWIDSAPLREAFEKNPVQCHLQTVYPVGGRSDAQRLHVIAEYRRCRGFLDLFSGWAERGACEPTELAQKGLNLPIFLFVHLLCPASLRRSVVVLSGGIEALWGDRDLWEEVV